MRHGSRITSELQGLLPQSWMLHRETNESWSVFALVHDEMIKEAAFGVHVSVKLARPGIDSFCLVDYEVIDISKLEIHSSNERFGIFSTASKTKCFLTKKAFFAATVFKCCLRRIPLLLKSHLMIFQWISVLISQQTETSWKIAQTDS